MSYAPVSSMLLSAHAKLGDLLHFNFFRNNPNWFYPLVLADSDPPGKSLVDVRRWLGEVATELERVANSTLLALGRELADHLFREDEPGSDTV